MMMKLGPAVFILTLYQCDCDVRMGCEIQIVRLFGFCSVDFESNYFSLANLFLREFK